MGPENSEIREFPVLDTHMYISYGCGVFDGLNLLCENVYVTEHIYALARSMYVHIVYANEETVTKWEMSHTIKPSTEIRRFVGSLEANWCGITVRRAVFAELEWSTDRKDYIHQWHEYMWMQIFIHFNDPFGAFRLHPRLDRNRLCIRHFGYSFEFVSVNVFFRVFVYFNEDSRR